MTDIVSVSVTRSGGFTGMSNSHRVKLADLPSEKAAAVRSLAERVAGSTSQDDPAARDAFRYAFHIQREDGSAEFEVIETEMSPDQRNLAQLVAEG